MNKLIQEFKLPRYCELPNVGLYLEQTTRYINGALAPAGCAEITASMVSNYVKNGFVPAPVKKQYYAEQIAHLMAVSLLKGVLPMEHIKQLFSMQKTTYTDETAYDYLCTEFENILLYIFGLKDTVEKVGVTSTETKQMLRCAIIAAANIIYLNSRFEEIKLKETTV